MSFSFTITRCENSDDFANAVAKAKASPTVDGRTKAGKRQNACVDAGKEALVCLAFAAPDGPVAGSLGGHLNEDGSGNIGVTLNILA